ncbi:MAG TPA: hypothetical protein VIY48_04905 [Candidatus Paceibacterota bacterium]
MMMTISRSYRELRRIDGFEERFRYLSLKGGVGVSTFGFDRYLNQRFYTSREWRQFRHHVIVRDNGCDLGVDGYEIHDRLYVHHMNPIIVDDIVASEDALLDPDNLITTTHGTHNAIHYGDERLLPRKYVPRERGDTRLW